MHCDPWEIIPIWDVSGTYIEMAIRYYQGYDAAFLPVTRAEVYYERDIDVFQSTSAAALTLSETKSHNFAEMPVVEFMSNDEYLGDFEKVASLIDAYDLSMSDAQNEIEEFRQAYQVYENCTIDADGKAAAREMGAINIPKGGKVTYLVKDLNPEYLDKHLKRIKENIYRFAKTVDMSEENFSGNAQSGESRKWKLLSLEFRATIRELKMTAGFMDEFRIAQFIWNAKGIPFDYLRLSFQFTRNLPMEMKESAENAAKLKGIISDKTLLGTLPFVEDVVKEMADLEEQAANAIDLSVEPYVNTGQV
jgi:SPP1 family phage portal protein